MGIALGIVLAAGAVVYHQAHTRPKRALERYKAELIAQGESFAMEDFFPRPVLRAEDGTENFRKATQQTTNWRTIFDTNPPPSAQVVAPGRAMPGWRLDHFFKTRHQEIYTNSWDEVGAFLENDAGAMDAARKLIERPKVNLNLNYYEGFNLLLPHLGAIRRRTTLLAGSAMHNLHRHDSQAATSDIRAMIAVANGLADEPLIISQIVRIQTLRLGFDPIWAVVQSPDMTEEQLAAIQRDLERTEFTRSMESAVLMERALVLRTIAGMRASSKEFNTVRSGLAGLRPLVNYNGSGLNSLASLVRLKFNEPAWRYSWSYTDELIALQAIQVLLGTTRSARSNDCFLPHMLDQQKKLAELGLETNPDIESFGPTGELDARRLVSQSMGRSFQTLNRIMTVEAARRLTITGIALRRREIKHGNLPQELSALVPEFLSQVPRDPVDGQPLRFKLTATNTFVLYSIGKDGVDDGGNPERPDPNATSPPDWWQGRDWLWPQPASEAEYSTFIEKEIQDAQK